MEVERGHILEKSQCVGFRKRRQRRDISVLSRWSQAPHVAQGNLEPLHQAACEGGKTLLPGPQRIAVMEILHLPLVIIVSEADIVMRREKQARAVAFQP